MNSFARTLASVALGGILVAAAALSALSIRPAPTVAAASPSDAPPAHSITVTATGTTTVVPDVVRVDLGITASRSTVAAVRSQAASVMTAVIAMAKRNGVAEKDIRTTNVSLGPQYAPGGTRIVGYTMSERVEITVRDMDKAGDIVDGATAAGANTVDGIVFDVADPASAQNDARVAAVQAARTRAQAMASAAGVSLGAVLSITDVSVGTPQPYYAARDSLAAGAATPVMPGTQDLDAQVTVVFELD